LFLVGISFHILKEGKVENNPFLLKLGVFSEGGSINLIIWQFRKQILFSQSCIEE
jgi:hypothetical protein